MQLGSGCVRQAHAFRNPDIQDMTQPPLPACAVDGLSVIELTAGHAPLLQEFFDANPEYFLAIQGEPASPTEAFDELHEPLPAGWSFSRQWRIGWRDAAGSLQAMANVTSDLLAQGVWHIGLFIIATARHGNGDAHKLYRDIETWAGVNGAAWLRLGVVLGNARAERFWESMGFRECRTRTDVAMGKRINAIRVLVKPLCGGTMDAYLRQVPRDRPEA